MATVTITGPLFDGRASAAVERVLDESKSEVGAQGLADVHQVLNARIRHPTPYYETQLLSERIGAAEVVHDRGVIYGPWLEGTGSRNATTRFEGYHAFRLARQALPAKIPALVEPILARHLSEMGG